MNAALLILLLAFAQDPGEEVPSMPSPELRCQNECHVRHCDQWTHCNEIPDDTAQLACKKEVNKTEERCRSRCAAS